ncbi:MAG: aminopeptidase [Bacilli bacterium]|nr:aminopeptidase [Bacilli bacterium]
MIDPRLEKMAHTIIEHSLKIQPGERVLIDSTKNCSEMIKYMVRLIASKGAIPLVSLKETDIKRELIINGSKEQFELMKIQDEAILNNVDVYINMMDSDNCYDMSDIPDEKRSLYQKYYFKPINFEIIVPKLRWITVDYPSVSSAQQFGMSTDAYEKYFFDAMTVDYKDLYKKMIPLKDILDKGEHVEIKSPKINLSFDIDGLNSNICSGEINLPDGEVFIAPTLYSANGEIVFNTPTRYQGSSFESIKLIFKNGKIIDYNSKTNLEKLKNILESDDGNKYIGEFAFGTNPNIDIPRSNILFDEKILGSFHIALGNSHSLSDNGNKASIHWDMVNMLTKEYGGGRIIIDDKIIQEDGMFIPEELKPLNEKVLSKKYF